MSARRRVDLEVEYALSLKRLKRFGEARSIFEQLLRTVEDEQLPSVIVNLATVCLQEGNGEEVVRLLEPFVRKVPENAAAWANLGQAYVFVGRYDDAEGAYGRALIGAPNEGQIRVMLAALYMDHLGRLEDAFATLDAAFDSGYESREWLVRTLTCSVLLNRQDFLQGLLMALRENFEEAVAKSMLEEAEKMTVSLARKYSGGESDKLRPDQDSASSPRELDGADTSPADIEPTYTEPNAELSSPTDAVSIRPTLPHLNFRFYDFHDFTIDYYKSPSTPNFLDTFLREWRSVTRDPRFAVASLRGSPFYFARCPNCEVHVLTNRDVGKSLKCHMCDHRWDTKPITGQRLNDIVASVAAAMGIRTTATEMVHVLLVQSPNNVDEEIVRHICERGGLKQLPRDRLLSIYLQGQFFKTGAKVEAPCTTWTLDDKAGVTWAEKATPPGISAVVRELSSTASGIRTMSTSVPSDIASEMNRSVHELMKENEEACRAAIHERRATAADYRHLADLLRQRGAFEEGEQNARAAVALDDKSSESWGVLGMVLFMREDFAGARDALEQAIALDPQSTKLLSYLSICYLKLGDPARAKSTRSRLMALSGGAFPLRG